MGSLKGVEPSFHSDEIEISEQELESVISWVNTILQESEENDSPDLPITPEEKKLLLQFQMSLTFEYGKIVLREKDAYQIKFF
jgi:hypothetical protein